jgi:hypothetical protein
MMFKAKIYGDGSCAHFLPKGCWVQNWCRTIEHAQQIYKEKVKHAVVVHRIIDFHWRKRRTNLGICKQNASNPRIRSSCCRILTPPTKFDTSKRNH